MLRPMLIAPVPHETARVARAAFPQGHRYLRLADALETLLTEPALLAVFPPRGPPAPPLAAGARHDPAMRRGTLRSPSAARRAPSPRLDGCPAPGAHGRWVRGGAPQGMSPRLLAGSAQSLLFATWLTWCRERHVGKAGGRQRTDSPQSLAAVRALSRIALVGATGRHAWKGRAVVAPAWWWAVSAPDWKDRAARRAEDDRLPTTQAARAARALSLGPDGWRVLSTIAPPEAPTRASLPRRGWATKCPSRKPVRMLCRP
jgi:transposase